jgi:hypothetical protein
MLSFWHTISACTKGRSHKPKKHSQDAPSRSGCTNPSAEIVDVEKQHIHSEEPQGAPGIDPMSAEVATAMDERIAVFGCKRTKLAEAGLRDSSVKSSAPPKVVHIFDDPHTAVTDVPPPRR